jgi:hypothetical protein
LAHKRPPIKKEATPKTLRGSPKKASDEKKGNPKNNKGLTEKDL